MVNSGLCTTSVAAITPEEPPRLGVKASSADRSAVRDCGPGSEPEPEPEPEPEQDATAMWPSLESTRQLETSLAEMIQELERARANWLAPVDRGVLVELLNRSLTAISHWSLQAQISRLENRSSWDSRLAVESCLIKKEVEFFRNKCAAATAAALTTGATSPVVPSSVSSSPTGRRRRRKRSLEATAGVSGPSSKAGKHRSAGIAPPAMRLVENSKPHPRTRRSSDNPSANDFVRVFHLEKL
ncbi:LAMI_0E11122g1_1 [Lachancea mirantina]|uniref:LAMI_0E11122g1_1 n=1 Tax=Lachancea mirantina TaxID=1230905 RepID=A0A1G4JPA5_9SACH|nr:LAMI_0E11122g1_1 [Lachancea mirantina]